MTCRPNTQGLHGHRVADIATDHINLAWPLRHDDIGMTLVRLCLVVERQRLLMGHDIRFALRSGGSDEIARLGYRERIVDTIPPVEGRGIVRLFLRDRVPDIGRVGLAKFELLLCDPTLHEDERQTCRRPCIFVIRDIALSRPRIHQRAVLV